MNTVTTEPMTGRISLTLQAKTLESLRLLAALTGESPSQIAEELFLESRLNEKVEIALQTRKTPYLTPPLMSPESTTADQIQTVKPQASPLPMSIPPTIPKPESPANPEEEPSPSIDEDNEVPW